MKVNIPNKFQLVDSVLHDVAEPFDFAKPEKNLHLANKMVAFMKEQKGIGLAAPQIGLSVRLFVMQTKFDTGGLPMHCFNPEIIAVSNTTAAIEEGCLSFPNEYYYVRRPAGIHVKYQNHQGDIIESRLWGLSAICFQHELDHLNGIVMHDRYQEQNDRNTVK